MSPSHTRPDPVPGQAAEPVAAPAAASPATARRRPALWRGQGPTLAVVAVGGAIGACARYEAVLLWPTATGAFPWTTMWINVIGCAVIGCFLVLITEGWTAHRLVRPFFGTGVLGGFTTFSTYAVDIQKLMTDGHPARGLAYLAATLTAAMFAVRLAAASTRRVLGGRQR